MDATAILRRPNLNAMTIARHLPWTRLPIVTTIVGVLIFMLTPSAISAPGDVSNCTVPINLSRSEGYVSADPLLIADPVGAVHLFWAERMIGDPDSSPNVPDSMMYSLFDGIQWAKPVDVHISPPRSFNRMIGGIRGVIDDDGVIHLVWLGPDDMFFYSSAHADDAGSAQGWQTPLMLGNDQTGTQYSADIAYEPPQTLHIIYGRSQNQVNRTVSYIRSIDGGLSWSEPLIIYTFLDFARGASNVRLHVDLPDKIYATWTEWDSSGTGQAIYFARSLDSGLHWAQPVRLAQRAEGEYERNWTNVAVLGEDHLVAFWEGGFRAYPQAQYSYDGGVTWTEAIDTLYWLIADNGAAEFVRDSQGRLHLFIARRIREGYPEKCANFLGCSGDGNAIWHSIWEAGPNWREPKPVDFTFSPVNYVSVAITKGNRVTMAWFDYTDFEIEVMNCFIEDAPELATVLRPTPKAKMVLLPTPTATSIPATPAPAATQWQNPEPPPPIAQNSTQQMILASFLPACAVVALVIVTNRRRRRH
jgi:hypothetical protein